MYINYRDQLIVLIVRVSDKYCIKLESEELHSFVIISQVNLSITIKTKSYSNCTWTFISYKENCPLERRFYENNVL